MNTGSLTQGGGTLLAIDWGTSSLRGALLDARGKVLEERSSAQGILSVPTGGFPAVFEAQFGEWARSGARHCLIAGMAGSKQGWLEAPYCACPAGFADIAAQLAWIAGAGLPLPVAIVPGLSCNHASPAFPQRGLPDVLRGEETQVIGAIQITGVHDGVFVLPGTHSKWVTVRGGRITGFKTYMSGEFYALLTRHSLLAKSVALDAPFDSAAFAAGVTQSRNGAGLLHNAFGTRTLALFARMDAAALTSYLSGLVIGDELRAQVNSAVTGVVLIGAPGLLHPYTEALAIHSIGSRALGAEATWAGLRALATTLEHSA
ncbi:MAG: 2-dehydro-3-deoxygalactonokinase [Burkholderiaceae bacterium]